MSRCEYQYIDIYITDWFNYKQITELLIYLCELEGVRYKGHPITPSLNWFLLGRLPCIRNLRLSEFKFRVLSDKKFKHLNPFNNLEN